MNTLYLVTVGLSILGKLSNPEHVDEKDSIGANVGPATARAVGEDLQHPINAAVRDTLTWAAEVWPEKSPRPHLDGANAKALAETLCEAVRFDERNEDKGSGRRAWLSAELEGLARHIDPEDNGVAMPWPTDSEKSVVLLASPNHEGKAALFWNAALLADGDLSRIEWHASGFDSITYLDPARIYAVLLPDLHAKRIPEFARNLGTLGRRILASVGGRRSGSVIHLVLSGGYKVALPYFLALGEWLMSTDRAVEGNSLTVDAWARHETSADLVELPLRRIVADAKESEFIRSIDGIRAQEVPRQQHLKGYVWVADPTQRLTPLGQGYLQFIGEDG